MRIAGFFLRTLLTLSVVAAVFYFFGGQVWLAISLYGFQADVKIVENAKQNSLAYGKKCQNSPGASNLSTPIAVQLRFLDSMQYQIELRCTLIEDTPVILSTGQLPMFVKNTSGSSGLYADFNQATKSTITLSSFVAKKDISIDTTTQFNNATAAIETYPATSCAGWGYRCCTQDQETGTGKEQTDGVNDCSGRCFAACSALPYIQSFVSDPYPASMSTIRMDSNQLTVTYSYSTAVAGGKIATVHIEYGDGASDNSTETTGSFVHTYTCETTCDYAAILTALDSKGNSSVVNDSARLYIKKE